MLLVRGRHLRPWSNDLVTLIPDIPPSLLWLEVSALDDSSRKDSPSSDGNQGTPRYEVGYCKPPTTTRFQKGKSGNPRGRPKEAKDKLPAINEERMKSILIEEAYRAIKVRDGSREVTIPMIRAVVRSMALAAVKGQARSQRMFTALLQATEKERKTEHDLTLETAIEYKTQWEDELERLAPTNLCSLASAPDLFDDRPCSPYPEFRISL